MNMLLKFVLSAAVTAVSLAGCAAPDIQTIKASSQSVTITVPRYIGGEQQCCVNINLLDKDIIHGVQLQLPCNYNPFVAAKLNGKPLSDVQVFHGQGQSGKLCFPVKIPPFVVTEGYVHGDIVIYILENYEVVGVDKDHPVAFLAKKVIPLSIATTGNYSTLKSGDKINLKYRPSAMSVNTYREIYRRIDPLPSATKKHLLNEIDFWLTQHHSNDYDSLRLKAIRNIIAEEKL